VLLLTALFGAHPISTAKIEERVQLKDLCTIVTVTHKHAAARASALHPFLLTVISSSSARRQSSPRRVTPHGGLITGASVTLYCSVVSSEAKISLRFAVSVVREGFMERHFEKI